MPLNEKRKYNRLRSTSNTLAFNFILCVQFLCFLLTGVHSDTPSNCTYEDARGRWQLRLADYAEKCTKDLVVRQTREVELMYPNRAVDGFGNVGEWTLIYNQGFEFTIAHRKWLVLFDYDYSKHESLCNVGMPGWTHDSIGRQWHCFIAQKVPVEPLETFRNFPQSIPSVALPDQLYKPNHDLVREINSMQNSWRAIHYPELEKLTLKDIQRRSGGSKSVMLNRRRMSHLRAKHTSPELARLTSSLPTEFDWRHPPHGNPSPVTPVRNQEHCGSCYAFASTAMLESRIRLVTNFTVTPILSPQDIVDCSAYSQGCDGGFPYLIAGKYAEDFGMVLEECNPYNAKDHDSCPTRKDCQRFYATDYHYLGGYYGACNEALMKLELVHRGPFAVGFEVYPDFKFYKSGVYHHTGVTDEVNKFNPFELTNHAVLVVGYGIDPITKVPYWAVKNSWGTEWGEDGFFRIRRGNDECGFESLSVSTDPVL